jgi:hypothetical protein
MGSRGFVIPPADTGGIDAEVNLIRAAAFEAVIDFLQRLR